MGDFDKKIVQAVVSALRDVGLVAFVRSQKYVPVITGQLKRSGYVKQIPGGIQFGYTANYAELVEYGRAAHTVAVPGKKVKPYRRRIPQRTAMMTKYKAGKGPYPRKQYHIVSGYTKPSTNKKVSYRAPSNFVGRALTEAMPMFEQFLQTRIRQVF